MIVRKGSNMKLGQSLIDKASKVCGSDAALARRMNVYPADVSNLRSGKRPLSPELAAELADIAGEDPRQAVIDAVIERNMGTRKEGAMLNILGKALAAGVAAMWLFTYSGLQNRAMAETNESASKVCTNVTKAISYLAKTVRLWRRFANGIYGLYRFILRVGAARRSAGHVTLQRSTTPHAGPHCLA